MKRLTTKQVRDEFGGVLPVDAVLVPDGPQTELSPTAPPKSAAPGVVQPAPQTAARAGGRFAVLNAFIDTALRDLTRAEAAVWLVLYRDTRDGVARTGQTDIARRAGVSVRAVRTALGRLVRASLVEVVRKGGRGSGAASYRVLPPGN